MTPGATSDHGPFSPRVLTQRSAQQRRGRLDRGCEREPDFGPPVACRDASGPHHP